MDRDSIAEAERRLLHGRRALRLGWLALFVSAPVVVWALPTRMSWNDGDPIVAAEINSNFEALWNAVEGLEDAEAPEARSAGVFDPLNGDGQQVDLPVNMHTVVREESIDVPGPGFVLAIATVTVASVSGAGAPIAWVDIVGDGANSGPAATYMALNAGTATSATVHGVFRVTEAGNKTYQARVVPSEFQALSRAAHISLVFLPGT